MAEKDISERMLESFNDVFSDIVNVLLFDGEQLVSENDLEDASPVSQMKLDGELHEQERDVAKFWKNGTVRLALCGLENQTEPDRDMVLRVLGYDGASYKEQVNLHIRERREKKPPTPPYPAVTLVLYFGEKPWNAPKSLLECFPELPEPLKPYVQDYRLNVFELAFLPPEKLKQFRSDFGIVADYLVQKRQTKAYVPSEEVIRHVDATLKLMEAVTGDSRFTEARANMEADRRKGTTTMRDYILDGFIQQGRAEGHAEGRAEGRKETLVLMREINSAISAGKTNEQILEHIPGADLDLIKETRELRGLTS